MIEGGIRIIQYREKRHQKSSRDILRECQAIRTLTLEHNVLFIINDYVDVALLVDADGVHLGQDDLPVEKVRQFLGPDKMIGLSTYSPEQAESAEISGAEYIGVGPLFATRTKEDVYTPVGLDYLDYIVGNSGLPFVAIGGIKLHTIAEVSRRGAKTICLVSEIVSAVDISLTVRQLSALCR